MKLNVNQKKTISGVFADLGKLIFLSVIIGKFVSDVKISQGHLITWISGMLILFILSILIQKN